MVRLLFAVLIPLCFKDRPRESIPSLSLASGAERTSLHQCRRCLTHGLFTPARYAVSDDATCQRRYSRADCPLTLKLGHEWLAVESNREITPAQAFGILIERIDKRKVILSRMDEMAYRVAQAELDIVRHHLVRARQYFMSKYMETTVSSSHRC